MALAEEIQALPVNPAVGEIIIGVLGVENLIENPRRLTKEQLEQIRRFPFLIRRATKRAMITSDSKKEAANTFDFKSVNKMLSGVNSETIHSILRVLPSDVGPVTTTVLGRVLDFLHQQLPRHVSGNMFRDDVRPGSPSELRAYARLWEVANDPLIVLHDLANDRLKLDRVVALETLYPELYQIVLASVNAALSEIKGQRPKWQPEPIKRKQIEMLTQAQDPGGLGQVMQAVWTAEKQPSNQSSQSFSSGNSQNIATQSQTLG